MHPHNPLALVGFNAHQPEQILGPFTLIRMDKLEESSVAMGSHHLVLGKPHAAGRVVADIRPLATRVDSQHWAPQVESLYLMLRDTEIRASGGESTFRRARSGEAGAVGSLAGGLEQPLLRR